MTIEKNLDRLRENIAKFSYTVDNCDMVMTNEYTGKIWFDLRTITLEKEPLSEQENKEYQEVLAKYNNAKKKLLECECKKIK